MLCNLLLSRHAQEYVVLLLDGAIGCSTGNVEMYIHVCGAGLSVQLSNYCFVCHLPFVVAGVCVNLQNSIEVISDDTIKMMRGFLREIFALHVYLPSLKIFFF